MALASTQRPDVDERDAAGRTTLDWACARGDHLAISQLLSKDANPDISDSTGRTPLHRAVESCNMKSLRLLLAAGADKELRNEDGDTALALSAITCQLDFMELLLDEGANIESQDRCYLRPSHCTAVLGRPRATKVLIKRGADFYARDVFGSTPYRRAIARSSQTTIKNSLTPNHAVLSGDILFFAALYGNEKELKYLYSNAPVDVDLRVKDEDDMTALEVAEWRRDNTSTCSKGSTQAPKRDLSTWFELFKALWDNIETRQKNNRPNTHLPAHIVDVESVGESGEDDENADDENNEIWEDATESQSPAPA